MNKIEITRAVIKQDESLEKDDKTFNRIYKTIWYSWRSQEGRRFRLTETGYKYMSDQITFYPIRYPEDFTLTNQILIDLDRFIDCPYYIDKHSLVVSSEKMAIQLVLFDGNLVQFGNVKRKYSKKDSKIS